MRERPSVTRMEQPLEPLSEIACRNLLEAAPIAIVVVAENGAMVAVNAEFERLFGYTRAEIIGKSMEMLLPERFRRDHVGERAAFNKEPGQRPMGHQRHLTALKKNGVEFPVEIGLSPIGAYGPEGGQLVTAMIMDQTARKIAEQERLEREETFRLFDENSPDFISIVDLTGRMKFISRALKAITGYEPAEIQGQHVSVLLAPDHIEEANKLLQQVMDGKRFEALEYPLRRKDGSSVAIEFNAAPFTVAGVPQGILAIGRDISRRKLAEEELRRSQEKIIQLKSNFVAMASHELRTPLAVIELAVESVLEKATEKLEDRSRSALEMAQRNVKRLGRLIVNLLDLARIEEGRLPMTKQHVDLRLLVEQATHSIGMLAEKNGIQMDVNLGSDPMEMEIDADRITQVLTNLYGNAVRFARNRITTRLTKPNGAAWIVIEDDGPGVPLDKVDHIFDRFSRISEHGGKSGTGLGLSISKGIVEAHGGELRAELRTDANESGMRFTVILPP